MFINKNKIDDLISEKERLLASINHYQLKIEKLEKENKKLIENFMENFMENYDYVLTYNHYGQTHLYQDGKEIKNLSKINFEASIDSIPTFKIEVH